jgi:hypothetical protein
LAALPRLKSMAVPEHASEPDMGESTGVDSAPLQPGGRSFEGFQYRWNRCYFCQQDPPDHPGWECTHHPQWTACWFCGQDSPDHPGSRCPTILTDEHDQLWQWRDLSGQLWQWREAKWMYESDSEDYDVVHTWWDPGQWRPVQERTTRRRSRVTHTH